MGPVTLPGEPCPDLCATDCSSYSFPGLEFEECDWGEHKTTDPDGNEILLSVSYECEYKIPTQTVCTKTLSFDDDGKKASSSWKTSEEPIIIRKRNLRTGRQLSDVELGEVIPGSCETMPCDDKCPPELIDGDIIYTLDNPGDCEDESVRGRCSYTNPFYTKDTGEGPGADEDTPCVEVCVIKNKSIEQKCYDPTKAATCTFPVDLTSDCYEGPCMIADCDALCPGVGCIGEYGGIDGLAIEGYECDDTDIVASLCVIVDDNMFQTVSLADFETQYGNVRQKDKPKTKKGECADFDKSLCPGNQQELYCDGSDCMCLELTGDI